MSIRNILALVSEAPESEAAVDAALAMGEAHGAHVVVLALAAVPELDYGYGAYGGGVGGQFVVEQMDLARQRVEERGEALRARLDGSRVSTDVRTAARSIAGLAEEVAGHGRYSDLTIISRGEESGYERALDGALLDSGRPVALLPKTWRQTFGRRITVAWDGSREAARAVAAATPLIARAEEVRIAIAAHSAGDHEPGREPGSDIGAALARHNRNLSVDLLATNDRSVSETLLAHANDSGSDLVVLGAYGHSRFSEALFGGVTYDMIHRANLPLLMTH